MVQIAILLFLSPFRSPFHEESSTLYSFFWIIFTLHLLIIWTLTWVLVPSATSTNFLWVAVAKVALFRGLLHINAASKLAVVHLMWWCQPSFRYFGSSSFSHVREAHSYHWTFLEVHFNCWIIYFEPYSLSPGSMYSLNSHSFALYLWNLVWEYFIIICLSLDLFISSDKAQGPIYDLGPLPLHIKISKCCTHLQNLYIFFFQMYIIFATFCMYTM